MCFCVCVLFFFFFFFLFVVVFFCYFINTVVCTAYASEIIREMIKSFLGRLTIPDGTSGGSRKKVGVSD